MRKIAKGVSTFLSKNKEFDFSYSRIHEFEKEIVEVASENHEEVKGELKRMQRIFQVSATPKIMSTLMENNLDSAYSITSTPKKSFIKMYGKSLGGELAAEGVYQRAEHLSAPGC